MLKQARLYIKGDVIGVGFRAWTKIQSKLFDIKGWVRNSFDREDLFGPQGGVEALVQGEESTLDPFIDKVREGPPISRVEDIEIIWETPKKIFDSFEIIK